MGSNLHRMLVHYLMHKNSIESKCAVGPKFLLTPVLQVELCFMPGLLILKYHTNVHRISQKYLYMICYEAYILFFFQGQSEA